MFVEKQETDCSTQILLSSSQSQEFAKYTKYYISLQWKWNRFEVPLSKIRISAPI